MQPKSMKDSSSGAPSRLQEVVEVLDRENKTLFTEILLIPSMAHQLTTEDYEGENWTARSVREKLTAWIRRNPELVPNWATFKDLVRNFIL